KLSERNGPTALLAPEALDGQSDNGRAKLRLASPKRLFDFSSKRRQHADELRLLSDGFLNAIEFCLLLFRGELGRLDIFSHELHEYHTLALERAGQDQQLFGPSPEHAELLETDFSALKILEQTVEHATLAAHADQQKRDLLIDFNQVLK